MQEGHIPHEWTSLHNPTRMNNPPTTWYDMKLPNPRFKNIAMPANKKSKLATFPHIPHIIVNHLVYRHKENIYKSVE